MRRNNSTRSSSSYPASFVIPAKKDTPIITEYERGSNGAAVLMCLMFLVLVIGTAVFKW